MLIFFLSLLKISALFAPFLLLGLILSALLRTVLTADRLSYLLGEKRGWRACLIASLAGIPLPLCSCSVMPIAISLRRQGASRGAVTSFLISTPQTGPDSLAVSWVLLGPFLTIVRPIIAMISALGCGLAVDAFDKQSPDTKADTTSPNNQDTPNAKPCCCSAPPPPPPPCPCCAPPPPPEPTPSCCTAASSCCEEAPPTHGPRWLLKFGYALHWSITTLLGDLLLWIAVGLVLAALIDTFVSTEMLAQWGKGPKGYLTMLGISIPMYICATASAPIAGLLLIKGVSPGVVVAFLLAGPATNLGTFGIMRQEIGMRGTVIALGLLMLCAIGCGILVDITANAIGWKIPTILQESSCHTEHTPWWGLTSLGLLAILATYALYNKLVKPGH